MGFCNCNQGRLPCTCKDDPVAEVIAEDAVARKVTAASELNQPNRLEHYSAMATDAAELVRITAERDALQLLLTDRDDRIDLLEGLLREVSNRASLMGWEAGLIESIDAALKPASDITGYDYRTDLGAYFGLSYASWLTLPRVLMQAMPKGWQSRMAVLLNEYDDAYQNPPDYGTTVRVKLSGKMIKTPAWLINYRHPDHAMIEQVRGTRTVQS